MRRSLAATLLAAALLGAALVVLAPAVSIAGACHGTEDRPVPGEGTGDTFKIDGCLFYPSVARVPVGTTVTFLNTGDIDHNVTGSDWASGDMPAGGRFEHRFAEAGVYPFTCTLHPGMNGAVLVGEAIATTAVGAALTGDATSGGADGTTGNEAVPIGFAALGGLALGSILGATIALAVVRPRRMSSQRAAAGTQVTPAD